MSSLPSESTLERLKACKGKLGLAMLLGVQLKHLTHALYGIPMPVRYAVFTIPKSSGGVRIIHAPNDRLKFVQSALAAVLQECLIEIETKSGVQRPVSHAFHPKRSIFSNAWVHRRKRFVVNFDLQDFFPSLHFGRVCKFFEKSSDFQLHPKVANLIANLATHPDGAGGTFLPQGSPCSPVISNLLTRPLDLRLRKLAQRCDCRYSRYADDLTFSSNTTAFPEAIAKLDNECWIAGDEFEKIVVQSGFFLNHAKTRMALKGTRQVVTGLVVNKQVSVNRDTYKWLRAACDSMFKKGIASRHDPRTVKVYTMARKLELKQLIGHAEHVFHARRKSGIELPAMSLMKGPELLLKRLIYYERFFAHDRPIVICEGDTDYVYLRIALAKFGHQFANLAPSKEGLPAIRFLRFTPVIGRFTGLQGGSDQLKTFLQNWDVNMAMVGDRYPSQPVILFMDNDSGANATMQILRGKKVISQDIKMMEFTHATKNLYVIFTPVPDVKSQSCIEDFVDPTAKSVKLDGKTFHPGGNATYQGKKWSDTLHYGKRVLAEKVVAENVAKYDFSLFKPILDRLDKAIADYPKQVAKIVASK
ncbi:RNA-directed DNA polymerase [Aureimonas flava]|uniref:RNA-directed DNA polymerase n=1 Tax=Aureimonas flava TaxID=2320271 RepID=A0A3A1WIF7_9HYPH|nr:retron Ec67 family RNA-directed DNA polymerase/endonuclease [Aureimonas flava]RIX99525.1 RNA-directed DNA polymerase [Aureimonas flava]